MTKIHEVRLPKNPRETRTIKVSLGTLMDMEAACRTVAGIRFKTGQDIAARELNATANELGHIRTEEKE